MHGHELPPHHMAARVSFGDKLLGCYIIFVNLCSHITQSMCRSVLSQMLCPVKVHSTKFGPSFKFILSNPTPLI